MLTQDSEKISVRGHIGTWYVIDQLSDERGHFFLLEHERYGDEAASLIVNENGFLVVDDVYNGFSDLDEVSNEDITYSWVRDFIGSLQDKGCLFLFNLAEKSVTFPIEALKLLTEKELPVAKMIILNDKGLSDRDFELLSLAHAVDDHIMAQDPYGYGDGFEDPDVFNDKERRISYMTEYLVEPLGLSATIQSVCSDISDSSDPADIARFSILKDRLFEHAQTFHVNISRIEHNDEERDR